MLAHRIEKLILVVTILMLAGCRPGEVAAPVSTTVSIPPPTVTSATPSITAAALPSTAEPPSPTPTSPSTWTPILSLTPSPTIAPYNKIPEITEDGWQTAALSDVGIDSVTFRQVDKRFQPPPFGLKVAELRQQKGFTQEQLAEKCEVRPRTIQRIEGGEVAPRLYTLQCLSEVLDFVKETFPTRISGW